MTCNDRSSNRKPRLTPELINRLLAMADAAGLHLVVGAALEVVR